jgi:ribonucleoside-diphosphate reductase alpha chain
MQGGDSCRLIAINLYSFVDEPFTKKASFNYRKFYEVTYEAQRLMDNLVDLELEAIERILSKVKSDSEPDYIKDVEVRTWKLLYDAGKKGRRTGLGFTALGDALAALGMKFDSAKGLAEIDKIMKAKCEAEFESSIDMSIERGAFEGFDPEIEKTSEFVQMMEKEIPAVHKRMMKHGRRNISLSTVAPTGTLSMLAQTSSGIEPVFMLSYKRRRKINQNDPNARVDFVDHMGDAWQEFTVYHPKVKEWMEITGESEIKKSPYNGSTAPEIDWIKRVQIQATVQKYITHSISSTINLPNDVSVEKVGDIYLEAWKKGLKKHINGM